MVLFYRDSLFGLNKFPNHKGLLHCSVNSPRFVHFLFLPILVALACIPSEKCWAGASASNWVVVVNADSLNSRTVANHYSVERNIPSRNVIVLSNIPNSDQITVDQFRELILIPILKEIESRGLAKHIQGIAYSADFPTAIDIQSDIAAVENKSPYLTPVGSINGLTYLFRMVLAKNPGYIGFESNLFAARPALRLLSPLISSEEQAKELAELIKASKHEDAAKFIESLMLPIDKELTYPMLVLSAQQWALAGNEPVAIKRIEQAIRAGWSYRDQIMNDPSFASLKENKDFQRIIKRCIDQPFEYLPSRGFDSRTYYTANTLGVKDPKYGVSYLMSMVLAVTRDLGNTRPESLRNLQTSIGADYTYPQGSFIYTKTADVRTTSRQGNFELAIRNLNARGMKARVVDGVLPPKGEKCSGLMIGTPDFSWSKSGCAFLPGAIADNLTSLGGAMTTNSQTKATEFLRFGAAASSGAVTEPYSIQNKFPHPMIHVHYVDGLTAAEAFYSSVTCPYQLLIVGDPLCQPYCKPPRFAATASSAFVLDKQPLRVSLDVDTSEQSTEPELLQWIMDGVLRRQTPFDSQLQILFNPSEAGAHEVRLVALAGKPLENRFEKSFWVSCGEANEQLVLKGPAKWRFTERKSLSLAVENNESTSEVRILHDAEVVGTIAPGSSTLELSTYQLGLGPVRLQAMRTGADGREIQSLPLEVLIEP